MPETSPANLDRAASSSSSSSSSSDHASVKIEEIEAGGGGGGGVVNGSQEVESKPESAIADNAVAKSSGGGNKSLSRQWSMPMDRYSSSDRAESSSSSPSSSKPRLHKSKTERLHKVTHILAEDAAKIFDDRISAGKKLKLLNRIATVKHDGTVEFEVPADSMPQPVPVDREDSKNGACPDESVDGGDFQYIPPMQIVMLIVGTRGDVQPFVAIAKRLQDYGHRVRLATHANFKEFVLTAGLEFYPLGGDPKVLAEYMVKNKGFLPSGPSEIPIQRNQMKDFIYSLIRHVKNLIQILGFPLMLMLLSPILQHMDILMWQKL